MAQRQIGSFRRFREEEITVPSGGGGHITAVECDGYMRAGRFFLGEKRWHGEGRINGRNVCAKHVSYVPNALLL
jgi:hypothetical protein